MGMSTACIEAHDLVLEYRDGTRRVRAVDGVGLTVQPGEFVGLVGPSGSGKSSVLCLLAGLRRPQRGTVRLCGRALTGDRDADADVRRRHVGFLFQEPFLIPYLSVRENALVHATEVAAAGRVSALAKAVGMDALLDERPHRLSGGERQRAGLLRALANEPRVVLADEPTASLDRATGRAVMDLLTRHRSGAGLVVVTHDPVMLEGADRVLHLADGRLVSAPATSPAS